MATSKGRKLEQQAYIKMHDNIVRDILDKTDIPFADIETTWFRKGQTHKYKGKILKIECEQPILISSYIDSGDGRHIRISNHEKKNGLPPQMINIVYNWQTGKVDNKDIKTLLTGE